MKASLLLLAILIFPFSSAAWARRPIDAGQALDRYERFLKSRHSEKVASRQISTIWDHIGAREIENHMSGWVKGWSKHTPILIMTLYQRNSRVRQTGRFPKYSKCAEVLAKFVATGKFQAKSLHFNDLSAHQARQSIVEMSNGHVAVRVITEPDNHATVVFFPEKQRQLALRKIYLYLNENNSRFNRR